MAKVILITTRHIEQALSGLTVYSIKNQRNYQRVFFKTDDGISALIRYIFNNITDTYFRNYWRQDFNRRNIDRTIGEVAESLDGKTDSEVKDLFDKLFPEEYLISEDGTGNLTLLENPNGTDDIKAVKKGIQRIEGTNIFICHEWFTESISGVDPALVEKTRIAYLKAILEDIKSEFQEQSIEWFLIMHDTDIATSIVADPARDIYPDPATGIVSAKGHKDKMVTLKEEVYKILGVEKDKMKIWIFIHADSSRIYKIFVNRLSENWDLLASPDSNIEDVINGKIDI